MHEPATALLPYKSFYCPPATIPGAGVQQTVVWANTGLSLAECAAASPVDRDLGTDCSPVQGVDMARKRHNIKNKKQICLCPSRLPRIKRLSFHSGWASVFNPKRRGHPCSLTWHEWVSSWVNHNAPGDKGQGAACCDVNLMTSCCSDGRSKQLNKGIVVFSLYLMGKGPLCLYSLGQQTLEPLWVHWNTMLFPKERKRSCFFPLDVPV